MGQIAVFSGSERRRRWTDEERLRILAEAFAPGACVTHVARRHDVSTGLIYTWRRKLRRSAVSPGPASSSEAGFAEALVVDDAAGQPTSEPAIIVDLARNGRVSIFASASPAVVTATLQALGR